MLPTKKFITYLDKIGFIDTEIELYLALIGLNEITLSELQKLTGLARTTIVENIQRLIEKGLVTKSTINNRLAIKAEPPSKLKIALMNKRLALQDKIDDLKDIDKQLPNLIEAIEQKRKVPEDDSHISVKYYEGKQGAKQIYQEAFSARELRSYVNLGETHKVFPENNALFIQSQIKNPSLLIKEIVDESEESYLKASQYTKTSNFMFKRSSIPTNLSSINILIFDGKVAMINFKEPITVSILRNKDYYENSVAIFEHLWMSLA